MLHSDRIRWFEAAYARMRVELVPDAPAGVALTVGWPTRKRSGKSLCVGECAFEVFQETKNGLFGCETLITLHPIQGNDLVLQLATLVHEMVHHSLPPEVKHRKAFQMAAGKIGLQKPWTATTPDHTLSQTLSGIVIDLTKELGFQPVGHFIPRPPKITKPSARTKLRCACEAPRTLNLPNQQAKSPILCGLCEQPFVAIERLMLGADGD